MHPRVLKSVADFGPILVLLESTRQLCDSRKEGCDVTFSRNHEVVTFPKNEHSPSNRWFPIGISGSRGHWEIYDR